MVRTALIPFPMPFIMSSDATCHPACAFAVCIPRHASLHAPLWLPACLMCCGRAIRAHVHVDDDKNTCMMGSPRLVCMVDWYDAWYCAPSFHHAEPGRGQGAPPRYTVMQTWMLLSLGPKQLVAPPWARQPPYPTAALWQPPCPIAALWRVYTGFTHICTPTSVPVYTINKPNLGADSS